MSEIFLTDLSLLSDPSVWIRFVVSIACGAAIGFERERHHKPSGLRTTMLICAGATIYSMTGIEIARRMGAHADPLRVAAQVVTGIGFIGAGVIMHVGATVKGLTTAAAIWVTAAVGTLIGLGYPVTALALTAGIIIFLVLLEKFESRFFKQNGNE